MATFLTARTTARNKEQRTYTVYGEVVSERPVALFDIDGVLVDCTTRLQRSLEEVGATKDDLDRNPEARRRFWRVFLSEKYMHLDRPVEVATRLLKERKKRYSIVIVTGRPEALLRPTIRQLEDFGVPFDAVVFRAQGYFGKDHEYKLRVVESLNLDVVEVHDDSPEVCRRMLHISRNGVFWWYAPGKYLYLLPLVAVVNGRRISFSKEASAEQVSCAGGCVIEYAGVKRVARSEEEARQIIEKLRERLLSLYLPQDVFRDPVARGELEVHGERHPTPLQLRGSVAELLDPSL